VPIATKLMSYGKVTDSSHFTFFAKTGKIFKPVYRRKSIMQDFPAKNFLRIIIPHSCVEKMLHYDMGYSSSLQPNLPGVVMEAPGMIEKLFGLTLHNTDY